MRAHLWFLWMLTYFALFSGRAFAAHIVLTVGPGNQYRTISEAVTAADADKNSDHYYVIRVKPGTYTNDFPHVTRRMTIETDRSGGRVLLKSTEDLPNNKGIILAEASVTIDGLIFTGAKIRNSIGGNGAGIRDENSGSPADLTVRNSTFTNNQNGILTGANSAETVTIVNSKFENNGNPTITGGAFCCQHALYVGAVNSLTVRDSLFCGQLIGHDIKSRASITSVYHNLLYDGAPDHREGCKAGSASYAIDVPNGGVATISRNDLIQGVATQNKSMIAYGEEGLTYSNNGLYLVGNTFVNSGTTNAIAIFDPHCVPVQILASNSFSGIATIVSPPDCAIYQ